MEVVLSLLGDYYYYFFLDMSTPPAKRKRLPYTQKYTEKWENDPKFKSWLTKSNKGPLYFHCKLCNSDGKAGKSEIEKHSAGAKHIKNVESVQHLSKAN